MEPMDKHTRKQMGPPGFYRGKDARPVSVSLTSLAKQILRGAQRRTGETASNVVERLLRLHGASVKFDDRAGS